MRMIIDKVNLAFVILIHNKVKFLLLES